MIEPCLPQEIVMAKVKTSSDDAVALPKALLEAHGISEGDDVEVSGGRNEVRLTVSSKDDGSERKLTVEEFIARLPRYDGPPITDEMIEQGIADAVRERWERSQR
jgi:antitoxin component of MazEF toxin-antitoxin module